MDNNEVSIAQQHNEGKSSERPAENACPAELMGKLAEYDLTKPAYKGRVRAEVVQRHQYSHP